jgi:hypothetical protein
MNRIKSHPDVGERWYPDLLRQIRAQQEQSQPLGQVPYPAEGIDDGMAHHTRATKAH